MACMCGDTYCWSCGPAQGNSKCEACGVWTADGGCEDPIGCELETDVIYLSQAADYCYKDTDAAFKQQADRAMVVADAWRFLKTTMALNEWPLEIEEEA